MGKTVYLKAIAVEIKPVSFKCKVFDCDRRAYHRVILSVEPLPWAIDQNNYEQLTSICGFHIKALRLGESVEVNAGHGRRYLYLAKSQLPPQTQTERQIDLIFHNAHVDPCLLYTSPSPRDS